MLVGNGSGPEARVGDRSGCDSSAEVQGRPWFCRHVADAREHAAERASTRMDARHANACILEKLSASLFRFWCRHCDRMNVTASINCFISQLLSRQESAKENRKGKKAKSKNNAIKTQCVFSSWVRAHNASINASTHGRNSKAEKKLTSLGVEPRISCSVGRRLSHWATRPLFAV